MKRTLPIFFYNTKWSHFPSVSYFSGLNFSYISTNNVDGNNIVLHFLVYIMLIIRANWLELNLLYASNYINKGSFSVQKAGGPPDGYNFMIVLRIESWKKSHQSPANVHSISFGKQKYVPTWCISTWTWQRYMNYLSSLKRCLEGGFVISCLKYSTFQRKRIKKGNLSPAWIYRVAINQIQTLFFTAPSYGRYLLEFSWLSWLYRLTISADVARPFFSKIPWRWSLLRRSRLNAPSSRWRSSRR